jgi:hypothetical protein
MNREFSHREIRILVALVSFPFGVTIRETLTRIWINGPGAILTQWLRLCRNIVYRDFGISVALCSCLLDIVIPETPI